MFAANRSGLCSLLFKKGCLFWSKVSSSPPKPPPFPAAAVAAYRTWVKQPIVSPDADNIDGQCSAPLPSPAPSSLGHLFNSVLFGCGLNCEGLIKSLLCPKKSTRVVLKGQLFNSILFGCELNYDRLMKSLLCAQNPIQELNEAYTIANEVDDKRKDFKEFAIHNHKVEDDSFDFNKFKALADANAVADDLARIDEYIAAFESWAMKHDIVYKSMEERLHGFPVFEDRLKHVEKTKGIFNHEVGLNDFSELTTEEFDRTYLRGSSFGKTGPPFREILRRCRGADASADEIDEQRI